MIYVCHLIFHTKEICLIKTYMYTHCYNNTGLYEGVPGSLADSVWEILSHTVYCNYDYYWSA